MKRPLLTGAAVGVVALLAPQVAAADCEKMMTEAAQAVGSLPDGTDYRVHDQLNEFYAEAEEHLGTNEVACMASVRRMQELIRRSGGAAGEGGPELTRASATGSGGGGGARAGFIPITPDDGSSRALESRIAGLSPAGQRDARALNDYATAARATGTAIVNGAPSPTPEVNAVARATNDAVEMAGAARDALIASRNKYDTMVRDLLSRLQGAQQDFQTAIQSGPSQFTGGAEAQVEAAKQQLAEANQRVEAVHQRAQQATDADMAEGMAPGFAAAFRAMQIRHQNELRGPTETWEIKRDEHSVALASMDKGRANLAYGELQSANNRLVTIRTRHEAEYDALLRQYSTMVIDLTQPDGVPQPDRTRPHTPETAGHTPPSAEVRSIEEEAAELRRRQQEAANAAEMRAITQTITELERAQANGDRSPETARRLQEARNRLRVAMDHEGAPTRGYGEPDDDVPLAPLNDPYKPWTENPSGQQGGPETPMTTGPRPVNPQYGPELPPPGWTPPSAATPAPVDDLLAPLTPIPRPAATPAPADDLLAPLTPTPRPAATPAPADDLLAPLTPTPRPAATPAPADDLLAPLTPTPRPAATPAPADDLLAPLTPTPRAAAANPSQP